LSRYPFLWDELRRVYAVAIVQDVPAMVELRSSFVRAAGCEEWRMRRPVFVLSDNS
jgi:hypothetical protein